MVRKLVLMVHKLVVHKLALLVEHMLELELVRKLVQLKVRKH